MMLNGVEIDHEASYEVVVNSFLAAGGDNFVTFAEGTNRADTGQIDLETFVDYMGEFSPVSPDLQERALDNSLLGTAEISWPDSLGDPPTLTAGVTSRFALDVDLPIELTEDFMFTVETPDGFDVEYGSLTDAKEFPTMIEGFPAGESSLPIKVMVGNTVENGDYELVFTLDRKGAYSVFDGNPLATPLTLTVPITVEGGLPPTGASTTVGLRRRSRCGLSRAACSWRCSPRRRELA